MGWLDGQVALVTGGGSGLGRAIVDRFLAEGARVGVLELSEPKVEQLRAELGEEVSVTCGDVRNYADHAKAVENTVASFGHLDTLVANVGVWDYSTPLVDLSADDISSAFAEMFEVNVLGHLLAAKAAHVTLQAAGGSMIFTISGAGLYPGGGGPLYTASKHALVGLVRQLALELAPDIRVNGVAPGGIGSTDLSGPRSLGLEAPVSSRYSHAELTSIAERTFPLGFLPEPADYVGAYTLLASQENAKNITGAILDCEGGLLGLRARPSNGADADESP